MGLGNPGAGDDQGTWMLTGLSQLVREGMQVTSMGMETHGAVGHRGWAPTWRKLPGRDFG